MCVCVESTNSHYKIALPVFSVIREIFLYYVSSNDVVYHHNCILPVSLHPLIIVACLHLPELCRRWVEFAEVSCIKYSN